MRQRGFVRAAARRRTNREGDMVFLLSGVVSAATAPRRVSLSRHSVIPPNGWIRGVDFCRARSLAR